MTFPDVHFDQSIIYLLDLFIGVTTKGLVHNTRLDSTWSR